MAPGPDNPLRQVIVNTHSPGVVQLVREDDLLFASEHPVGANGAHVSALQVVGMQGSWRAPAAHEGATRADILPYLVSQPGRQIALDVA
jgi:hypothetical protein